MNNLSVMMMETYVSESAALRVKKLETLKSQTEICLFRDILDVNVYDAAEKVRKSAYDAIYAFASPADAPKLIKAIDALTTVAGVNVKEARRRIAGKLIEDNSYKF
jgi:hypothetical protein